MGDWLLVLAGGAVGAPTRYLIGETVRKRRWPAFHWGTFLANTAASGFLGFFVEAGTAGALDVPGQALLSTGFCGALSTWSTFSQELLSAAGARRITGAAGYLLATIAFGMGLSFAGAAVARTLW